MKLELPNGIALSLWENEVDGINLQDSHIEIVRPSGRILRISLSESWLKTRSNNMISAAPTPQALSLPHHERPQASALALKANSDLDPKPFLPSQTFQKRIDEIHLVMDKFARTQELNATAITSLKNELAANYTELKGRLENLEMNEREFENMDMLQEGSEGYNNLLCQFKDFLCTSTIQKENSEPQEAIKFKTKKKI